MRWSLGVVLFFFSSRRRHTRFDCDWSSDVCSSDLEVPAPALRELFLRGFGIGLALLHVALELDHVLRQVLRLERNLRRWRLGELRSGEGRGGEEGRSRWVPDPLKKKRFDMISGCAL